ncbi:hypothetical protein BDV12DRAFT_189991 [Aspergillus spectabilis]
MINGRSPPLLVAAEVGYLDAVERLLDRGANVNRLNLCHETALSLAAQEGDLVVVEALLRYAGIEPDIPDSSHQTPLWWACSEGYVGVDGRAAVVEVLLQDSRVDPAHASRVGTTPLHCASWDGQYDVLMLLLAREDIDVNCHDNAGWTPFIWAAFNGVESILQLFLADTRVNVNAKEGKGMSGLCYAAKKGHKAIVEALLEDARVDALIKANNGKTAIDIASENGREEVVKLLEERTNIKET